MNYADISHSKKLGWLFQESEMWWVKTVGGLDQVVRKESLIDYFKQFSQPYYPAITTDMALEVLPDYTRKLGNLEISKCETDHMTMKKHKEGWWNISYWTWETRYTEHHDGYLFRKSENLYQDKSLVNALMDMISYLVKEGIIKKEKL